MKKFLNWFLFYPLAIICFSGCGEPAGYRKPADSLEAGREFIRAVLDADYKRAEKYVLPEEEDVRLFLRYRDYMKKRPQEEISNPKSASIIINKVENVNDSVTIINYANSFSREPMEIKVVKSAGEWWVDFSYTFSGNLPIE